MDSKKFSVKFFITTHEDSGIKGAMPVRLRDKGWDSYIPGFAPGHDLVEHGANEFGALYQELQALGAVLYVRGFTVDTGYYVGQSRASAMCSDFVSSFNDARYADTFRDLLAFPSFPKFKLEDDEQHRFDTLFEEIEESLREYWDSEINYFCCSDYCTPENMCDDCTPIWFFEGDNWEKTKTAMMYGYVKAKKRWGALDVYSLKDKIDKAMREVERHCDDLEGSEFTLKCEVNNYGASARVELPGWLG